MSNAADVRATGRAGATRAVAIAWLVAGTIDILAAFGYCGYTAGATPRGILLGIASGVLGRSAFDGGAAIAALGLVCHYTIALIWTALFFAMYRRIPFFAGSKLLTAMLYGVFVSLVMNLMVVPLSKAPPRPFVLSGFIVATLILILAIGLPLSIIVGGYVDRHTVPLR